jgi:hypothetical protein
MIGGGFWLSLARHPAKSTGERAGTLCAASTFAIFGGGETIDLKQADSSDVIA